MVVGAEAIELLVLDVLHPLLKLRRGARLPWRHSLRCRPLHFCEFWQLSELLSRTHRRKFIAASAPS